MQQFRSQNGNSGYGPHQQSATILIYFASFVTGEFNFSHFSKLRLAEAVQLTAMRAISNMAYDQATDLLISFDAR